MRNVFVYGRKSNKLKGKDTVISLIQIIEIETDQPDRVTELSHQWERETRDRFQREFQFCADRDRPNTYIAVAEFDSQQDALVHASDPATQELMVELTDLCGAAPRVKNLTVIRSTRPVARVA